MLLVDSGPLIAAFDQSDGDHEACAELLLHVSGPLILPATVVAEVGFMLARQRFGAAAEASFLRTLADETFVSVDLLVEDYARMADLVEQYDNLPLGTTDASVIALAERLRIEQIATLDHRHFRVVRPRHCTAFHLLP